MSLVVDAGSNRTPAPEGTFCAYCFGLYDLGTQSDEYQGKKLIAKKLWLHFELIGEKDVEGKPIHVGSFYTASIGEKANLRKVLESWRGKQFTADELKGFSMEKVVGAPCMITIIHKAKQAGGVRDQIAAISACPKGYQPPLQLQHPKTILSLDPDKFDKNVYEALPNFLKDKIFKSPEGLKVVAPGQPNGTAANTNSQTEDTSIPF